MAYVLWLDVERNLGRSLSSAEQGQAELWIDWAEATIRRRMGDLDALDEATLAMVVVEAVTARMRSPEAVTQVDVQIEGEGSVSRRYQRSSGLIDILPEWWAALGWLGGAGSEVGAFTVTPYGES